jgi:rubrerythrin
MKNDDRAVNMLKTALEMEEKGKKFYDDAVVNCSNELGKDIFSMLRDDELLHMDRIRTIYDSLMGGKGWSEDWKALKFAHKDLDKLFKEMARKHGKDIKADTSDMEAIDVGLDFELKSVKYYEEHLERADSPKEREFLERMIGEERTHHSTLSDMKLYLADPSAWFIEKERHGLDGA